MALALFLSPPAYIIIPMSLFSAWRLSALTEGVSYLLLLFIAMPMKYVYDLPTAVRIVGSLHGALFVAFMALLVAVLVRKWMSFRQGVAAFIASLLPFGAFVFDRYIKKRVYAQAKE